MSRRAYLDHNATSPLRPEARAAMQPWLEEGVGNPASVHAAGRRARAALDRARAEIAAAIGADADAIVFTSGGTEANNLALLGATHGGQATRIVVSAVEHPSVLACARHLERSGRAELVVAPVDGTGRVDVVAVRDALRAGTTLVSCQLVNHEVGTIQPIPEVAAAVRNTGARLHVDAVQALGRVPLDVRTLGADLVTLSAHKVGGPVGVGALVRRADVPLEPLLHGGAQEGGLRPGTTPVALAVGFAAAVTCAVREREERAREHARWRARLWDALRRAPHSARLNGSLDESVASVLNVAFPNTDRESLLVNLDLLGVEVSAGAACASGTLTLSPVLAAMGLDEARARASLRISLGWSSRADDVERLLEALADALPRSRASDAFFC